MKTITDIWNEYRAQTLPPDAGPIQLAECERAFYAGSLVMFNLVQEVTSLEEAAALQGMSRLQEEILHHAIRYVQMLKPGGSN